MIRQIDRGVNLLTKLLTNIKVIEFTHMVMGPAAGLVLADLGANVIKVEPITGDKTRTLRGSGAGYFSMYNRNKKSIAIDLKCNEGNEIALKLIDDADVVIENFRSGSMDAQGFGYDALSKRNPKLIYCSEKGFLDGPYANRTALDEIAQMMGGLAYMTGPTGRPLRSGASVIDVTGGMFGAISILAALQNRAVTGKGCHVKASLFESTAFLVGQHIAQYAVTGVPAAPMPERISAWAVYDVFETKSGEKVFVGVVSDRQWFKFCKAFALDDWIDKEGFKTNNERVELREEIIPHLRKIFLQYEKNDLLAILEEIGLPFAPIMKPEELINDPHLRQSHGLLDITTPEDSNVPLPALPIAIDGKRPSLRLHPPKVGEHTTDSLREIGLSSDQIKDLLERKIVNQIDR